MRRDTNNKGMTLMELIIAIAISSIVIIMIITFISGALKGFHKTNDEVQLQMEAQTVLNQITNIVLQAKSVSDDLLPPDSEEDRYLIEGNENYVIIFDKSSNKLYLEKITAAEGEDLEAIAAAVSYSDKTNLFAEYATELSFTTADHGKSVLVKLTLSLGEDEFSVSKKVALRNAI